MDRGLVSVLSYLSDKFQTKKQNHGECYDEGIFCLF